MRRVWVAGILLVLAIAGVVVATAANAEKPVNTTSKAVNVTKGKKEVETKQYCSGEASTFVLGLGQKYHDVAGVASGTDWYFDPTGQRYYTGGAGLQCGDGCAGNAQDECTVDLLNSGTCSYGAANGGAFIYGTVDAAGDWTGVWIGVEWHAMCYSG